MFKVEEEEKKLGDDNNKIFHSFVIKAMFLTKLGHADLQPAISFLASRVK